MLLLVIIVIIVASDCASMSVHYGTLQDFTLFHIKEQSSPFSVTFNSTPRAINNSAETITTRINAQ
jgi:hypothetical protein